MKLPSICVVVTTYNWPSALSRVLHGLSLQTYPNMEVVVADDGSTDDTAQLINSFRIKAPFALTHCWQPDEGFRAAMCRNKAVAKTNADYIIFIDGDCVPGENFVQSHAVLARRGWYVAGTRVLLSRSFTQKILNEDLAIESWSPQKWAKAFLQRGTNRLLPKLHWPLGKLRNLMPYKWQGVKTCNLGLWRDDFLAVNGLDENFVGWGFEDSDLIIRLQRLGIKRKSGKFATEVFHLWHPENSRQQMNENKERLELTLKSSQVKASLGIKQYI